MPRKDHENMKHLTRLTVIFLIIAMLLSLSACRVKLDRDVEISSNANITSIDVYNYTEDFEGNATELRELSTPTYTVPAERISEVAKSIEDVDYEQIAWFPLPIDYAYVFSYGYVIVIEYDNGGYDIIAEHGTLMHRQDEDGNYHHSYTPADYRGDIPWSEFVESFVHE